MFETGTVFSELLETLINGKYSTQDSIHQHPATISCTEDLSTEDTLYVITVIEHSKWDDFFNVLNMGVQRSLHFSFTCVGQYSI